MKYATICCAALGMVLALAPAARAATVTDPRQQLEALAVALERIGRASDAARFREAVAAMPPDQLDAIYGGVDLMPLADGIYQSGQARAQVMASTEKARKELDAARAEAIAKARSAPETVKSGQRALPDAPWPTAVSLCPTHATPDLKSDTHQALETQNQLNIATKTLEETEIVYNLGKGIWDGISRACKQEVMILGVGGNFSLACIPIDIVFAVVQFAVSEAKWGVQFWQQSFDRVNACDAAVETAEKAGTYLRLGHVHDDLTDFKQNIDDRLAVLDGKADLALKVLLESDLHQRSTSRLNVNYTVRLEAACDAAQEAIDRSVGAGYAPSPGAQALQDLGRKLMPTDPKRAFELCQNAYRMVTAREAVRKR